MSFCLLWKKLQNSETKLTTTYQYLKNEYGDKRVVPDAARQAQQDRLAERIEKFKVEFDKYAVDNRCGVASLSKEMGLHPTTIKRYVDNLDGYSYEMVKRKMIVTKHN